MNPKQLFQVFSGEEQAALQKEAEQIYDPAVVRASARKWQGYSPAERQRIGAEGNAIYADLVAVMPLGPASAQAQACVERWRRHMDYFWTPNPEQLLGLAEGYHNDPRFRANFDRLDAGLTDFLRQAVAIYVKNLPE